MRRWQGRGNSMRQALDAAMDCFWRDGYEASSVRDLAARMGITGASLYNAFGDKRRCSAGWYSATPNDRRANASPPSESPLRRSRRFAHFSTVVERSLRRRSARLPAGQYRPRNCPRRPGAGRRGGGASRRDRSLLSSRDNGGAGRRLRARPTGPRTISPDCCSASPWAAGAGPSKPQRELLEGVVRPALALLDWPIEPAQS